MSMRFTKILRKGRTQNLNLKQTYAELLGIDIIGDLKNVKLNLVTEFTACISLPYLAAVYLGRIIRHLPVSFSCCCCTNCIK